VKGCDINLKEGFKEVLILVSASLNSILDCQFVCSDLSTIDINKEGLLIPIVNL
jgi:hypothetical protein